MVLLETRSNIGDSAVEVPIAGSLGGLLPGRWLPATAVASFDLERELPVELRLRRTYNRCAGAATRGRPRTSTAMLRKI
jgi:hypothetical protein